MNYRIVYEVPGSTDMWDDGPGRLFTPVPRNKREVQDAVGKILAQDAFCRIVIEPEGQTKVPLAITKP